MATSIEENRNHVQSLLIEHDTELTVVNEEIDMKIEGRNLDDTIFIVGKFIIILIKRG